MTQSAMAMGRNGVRIEANQRNERTKGPAEAAKYGGGKGAGASDGRAQRKRRRTSKRDALTVPLRSAATAALNAVTR